MKIIAKRKQNFEPFYDKSGKLVWDGKAKNVVCTEGDDDVVKFMFNNMKKYIDLNEWDLKLRKSK